MLAVPVDLDVDVVSMFEGVAVTCLHRSADAQVDGEIDVVQAISLTDSQGTICRSIIYDDVVIARLHNLVSHRQNAALFVVGWNHKQDTGLVIVYAHETLSMQQLHTERGRDIVTQCSP